MANSEKDVESGTHRQNIPHWKLLLNQGILTQDVIDWDYEGSGTEEDPYIVEWIDNDPRDPMGWTNSKKWTMCVTMAIATLTVSFCSSAYSGGLLQIVQEFNASQTLVTGGMSLFVLGFALGPLLWAPISELYGRQIVFFITFTGFVAFNAGAGGSQNIWTLLILRFFAGSFGSSPLTNAGGVVADLFNAKERGMAMGLFSIAPFMGPVIGPIAASFLGMNEGWRWVEGMMAIFSGVAWIFASLLVPETYAPLLLRKRAQALSKLKGKVYMSRQDKEQGKVTASEAFATNLKRPWILLFCEPIVLLLSLYMAVIYGTLYLLFGAFPIVYRGRGWNEGVAGLPFIGVAIGMILALSYTFFVDNKRYLRCAKNSPTGFAQPEDRLPSAIVGGLVLPIGLFWFAWTNYPHFPWPASVAAAIPFGFGMVLIFLGVMNYLVDAYTIFAASVLAGSGIIRSLFGAAFPLFTPQMYRNLGIHWASMIPAFLSLACAVFPFLLYKYGAAIRKKCKYSAQADAFMEQMRNRAMAAKENHANATSTPDTPVTPTTAAGSQVDLVPDLQDIPVRGLEEHDEPRFAEMKTEEEQNRLERGNTVRTMRSTRSTRSNRTANDGEYEVNPYEIDRVHTRDSFVGGSLGRANSRGSAHMLRTLSRSSRK